MVVLDAIGTGYGSFAGVAPSHAPALLTLLVWPAAIAGRRFIPAATARARLAALLLAADAVAHLGLVPGHLAISPGKALLFLTDGVMLAAAAVLVFKWRPWRWVTVPLLVGGILVYLGFLAAGAETADEVGVLTKLLEVFAVLVCLAPTESTSGLRCALRWTAAVGTLVLLTTINGMGVWVIALRDASASHKVPVVSGQHHLIAFAGEVLQPASTSAPSPAARAAAARLVEQTRQGIAKYQDVSRATADGYRATTPLTQPTVHFALQGKHDKGVNPSRPEALVYATTRHGLVLLGALFEMPSVTQRGPDLGGAVRGWHMHENVCFTLVPFGLLDLATPYGFCPTGAIGVNTAEMLHVWTVNNPTGPFGDLDERFLRLVRSQ